MGWDPEICSQEMDNVFLICQGPPCGVSGGSQGLGNQLRQRTKKIILVFPSDEHFPTPYPSTPHISTMGLWVWPEAIFEGQTRSSVGPPAPL